MGSSPWTIAPCSPEDLGALRDELGVSSTLAAVLVRRGYVDPAAARTFLEGALPGQDPLALGDMGDAVETIRAAVAAGRKIAVHGDYDADGICATALAVFLLRELGAEPVWHLPSRFEEGYGLAAQTIARLAEDGVELVLTVDCGITAVAEVAEARRLGLDVVVTDHHRPAGEFPDCPVVAPLKGDYPFAGLCGTAVVWKLAEALLGSAHPFLDRHLDVVALATVAVSRCSSTSRALALAGLRRVAQPEARPAGVDEGRRRRSRLPRRVSDRLLQRPATTLRAVSLSRSPPSSSCPPPTSTKSRGSPSSSRR
jgi:single-stranded-DNA-specific exonuclease